MYTVAPPPLWCVEVPHGLHPLCFPISVGRHFLLESPAQTETRLMILFSDFLKSMYILKQ